MKQTIEATYTHVQVSVKAGTIFSWSNLLAVVMKLKKRLPDPWKDVIPVESVEDLKMCILLIACLVFMFVLAGSYDVMTEGGKL